MDGEFRFWSKNFILTFLSNLLYFGSFYLLIPTMPQFVDKLGGTPAQIGMVIGFFTMASVIVRPFFGRLADRFGRKLYMLIGSGIFTLIFLFYMHAQTVSLLYIIRILHGFAHAAFLASSAAYVAEMAPPNRRGEVIGMYGTSNVLAMAVFPAIGTTVIQQTGSFYYLFTVSALVAAAAFFLITGLKEISPQHTAGAQAAGILTIGRRKEIIVPSIALFAGATAYGATITFLPVYAPERGLPDFGIFFTAFAVFTLLSRVSAGKLSDKIDRYKVIIPFMGLVAIAAGLLPSLNSYVLLIAIGCCFGFGFGAFMPTLNALVIDKTPPRERGSALGFFTSFMDLGITAGSVVLGITGEYYGYAFMFYLAGAVMVAGIGIFAYFMRP